MRDHLFLKILLLVFVVSAITTFYVMGADQYLSLPYIKSRLDDVQLLAQHNFFKVAGIFCFIYISLSALSIPGTLVLTLLAGAIFGVFTGTLLVMGSSTIGASIAFLMARYLFRDFMTRKFHKQFINMDRKIRTEGRVYLLILRMIPVSPFVVINNVMGLTNMRLWTFFYVTYLGMLPGTVIYIFAGQKISQIDDVSKILSWPIVISLTLIGLLPILTKKIVNNHRRKHHMGAFS